MILAAVAVLGSAYFIFFEDRNDFIWLFAVSLLTLMIAYVFQYQIDQLMIRGVPQKIDQPMRQMLLNTAPHYASMTPQHALLIEDRMQRWIIKKEFINKNEQDAPEDVKVMLAYYAALLTIHQEDFLYDKIDRIVFYHHPFLSPDYPDDVHIVEVEPKDGTMILSVPHLLKGHLEKGYYNIALHAMAEAFAYQYLKEKIEWPTDIWDKLESISSMSKPGIENYLGMPLADPWSVALHHQVIYRDVHIPEVLEHFPQLNIYSSNSIPLGRSI